jgi:hypothetical protein
VYLEFLRVSWIGGQIRHHEGKMKNRLRISRWLEWFGLGVFTAAIIAAAAHVLAGVLPAAGPPHAVENALTFIAISFPAIGAAVAGIRTHREFARLVKRSGQMAAALRDLDGRMQRARKPAELEALIRETEELMLRESQEWLMLMRLVRFDPA